MTVRKLLFFLATSVVIAACDSQVGLETGLKDLDPPTGVVLVSATTSTLTFSWDKVSGADLYTARLETPAGKLVANGQVGVTENNVKFEKLTADTEYLSRCVQRPGQFCQIIRSHCASRH